MITYQNSAALVVALENEELNEWISVNVDKLRLNLLTTPFYLVSDEELWELEAAGLVMENRQKDIIPKVWQDTDIFTFLEFSIAQGIIDYLVATGGGARANLSMELICQAWLYYYENDAFMAFT